VSAELGGKANWSDSADLAMMFRGAYSSEFYRALAEAMHHEVRRSEDAATAWARVRELERTSRREVSITPFPILTSPGFAS
jgi:anaerobic magnesium-protoporphyrin IX monomethyl ester cyclase